MSCKLASGAINLPTVFVRFVCSFKQDAKTNDSAGKIEVRSVEYDWKSPRDFKVYKVVSNASTSGRPPTANPVTVPPNPQGLPRPPRRLGRSRPQPTISADTALLRRKHIYRNRLYSLHVGSNRLSRFRDLTPQTCNGDEELVSRARKWVRTIPSRSYPVSGIL